MQAEDWIWPTGGGLLTPGLDQPGMVDLCLILKATILSIWGFSPLRWTKPGTSSVLQVSDGSKFLLEVVITGLEIHSLALLIANFQRFYLGTVHPPPQKKRCTLFRIILPSWTLSKWASGHIHGSPSTHSIHGASSTLRGQYIWLSIRIIIRELEGLISPQTLFHWITFSSL